MARQSHAAADAADAADARRRFVLVSLVLVWMVVVVVSVVVVVVKESVGLERLVGVPVGAVADGAGVVA